MTETGREFDARLTSLNEYTATKNVSFFISGVIMNKNLLGAGGLDALRMQESSNRDIRHWRIV
jgi:hypothetical protein